MDTRRKGDLTDMEKELFQVISKGDLQEVERLLGDKNVHVNCLDEHGMTPLMHAAYKGKATICRLLLQHGGDVNCNEHEHGYSALMFAGLSGNTEITWMLLEAGADTEVQNSVGRTAAQMAAFVGQHDCVTVINNFFSREKLEYYTKPQGLDPEPKLPNKLAGVLHRIITTTNLHPVKIIMMVKENPCMTVPEALKKCSRVLDIICEKYMKQRDMNEVLAMKMHYLSCILLKCATFVTDDEDNLDILIKCLLKGRENDGFPVYQEKLIRECIRKFPYCEATLLHQLVTSIAPVEIGNDPTAFSVLTQAVNGHVGFMDADFCSTCGTKGAEKRCSVCKMVIYCNEECQTLHWFTHKKVCKNLKEKRERHEAEAEKERKKQEHADEENVTENKEAGTTEEHAVLHGEVDSEAAAPQPLSNQSEQGVNIEQTDEKLHSEIISEHENNAPASGKEQASEE
ncbi:ankyrin repeat and MYND domain-containing protein 2 isoform X2 [Protopterus annectens]|uniref:ankyrin repeat and MYND domain-containing protein 2 isoform X2 n=1 Tax=Protopterus annectens TaxID=7888 RepID=UPI001CFA98CA|nr:ankyrin repeat and MYND domain-containing protein 2 isoform X2 [Protopterus annectens]